MSVDKKEFAVAAILFGVLGFSLKSIFIKLAYADGIDALTLMGCRMGLSLPFFILAYWMFRQKGERVQGSHFRVIACALLYYVSSLTDIMGLSYVSVNIERIILFTIPIFVLVMSCLFLKKSYQKGVYIAAFISWVGVAISFASKGLEGGVSLVGIALVIVSSAMYAGYMIISGIEMKHQSVLAFNAQVMTLSCLFALIPVMYQTRLDFSTLSLAGKWTWPLCLALFSTVLPSFFMMYGMKRCGAMVSATFNNIGPFITMFAGFMILNEDIAAFDVVGMVVVLASIYYINKQKKLKQ